MANTNLKIQCLLAWIEQLHKPKMKTKVKKMALALLICTMIFSCKKEEPEEEAGFPPVDWSVIQWGPTWIPFDTNLLHVDTNNISNTTYCFRGKGRR